MKLWLAALLVLTTTAGCKRTERAEVAVYAASSLTEAFGALAQAFHEAPVSMTFAGSQVLCLQIQQGAPADVFASADEAHVRALVESGEVETSVALARNELVVVVPHDNPAGIVSFADLPRAQRVVLGTPNVPVGRYARELLDAAGPAFAQRVLSRVVSEESNARLVRAKVALGEADAAIVYRTDAAGVDAVRVIPVPEHLAPAATYHIAVLRDAAHPEAAAAFVGWVQTPQARRILAAHGFVVDE